MKNIGFAYVIATVALFANVSVGEEVSDEADKITLTTRDKAAIEALSKIHGYSLGYFKVQPEVNFFYGHDDNIFAEHDNEQHDDIYGISGNLSLKSDWDKHKLNFNAGLESGRYDQYDDEDYDDYWLNTDGRYDLSKYTNFFGGLSFSEEHEDRGSPDDQFGDEPTTYTSTQTHAGASQKWGNISLRLGGTYEALDYDDVGQPNGGKLNNDDRDRDLYGAGVRLSYKMSPRLQPFFQTIVDNRRYDSKADDNGYERDSDGYRFNIGVEGRLSQLISGSAYIGYIRQEYDDRRFDDVNELDIGGNLKWQMSPYSNVNAYLSRTLEETTRAGSAGYLLTVAGINMQHRFSRKGTLTAHLMLGEENYQDSTVSDDIIDWGIAYRHFLTKNVYLDTSYRLTGRDSSEDRLGDQFGNAANPANRQDYKDYYSNAVFFTIGALLYPVPESPWSGASRLMPDFTPVDWGGLYFGAQYGQNTAFSQVEGPRGEGTDVGEYGDKGNAFGPFLGYGWRYQNWYLGLEAEYEKTDTTISHSKSKDTAQTIRVEKNKSYGGSLRLGYMVPNGALIYSRLGWLESEFDTNNKVNNQPTGYDDSDWETGILFGLGLDIPAGEHLFVRMDYRLTDYDDYTADYLDNQGDPVSANYDNDETLFRVGLGWHFDKQAQPAKRIVVDHNGLYVGLQLGHGSIGSDTKGVHRDGDGASNFSGEFADGAGVNLGGFIGYGYTFNHWYLSIEGEADTSSADWEHQREPNGRNFSVDKKGSYGLSGRIGYLLDSGTLLYLRAGAVKTRFNTVWSKGENRENDIERDDNLWGKRVGIGAEVPLTSNLFVRFDYSYTDYNDYDFVTSHANTDSMEFNNDETIFRVALSTSL